MAKIGFGGMRQGAIVTVDISGQIVSADISGQTVFAKISGETVELQSGTGPILASISGETVIAKISGETLELQSGTGPILASISGETVELQSGTGPILASISGETVIAKISGETILTAPWIATDVKTGPVRTISDNSGGVVLHSGAVKSLKVKANPANSGDIYVGGSTDRPYSGFGFCLSPGEAEMMDVGDFQWVYLCAQVSGDKVCFDGIND